MGLGAQPVGAAATILPEVRTNFLDALEMSDPRYNETIDQLVDKVAMDSRLEKYAYWEMKGNPRRWDENTSIPEVTMAQKMYLLQLHNWGAKMKWSLFDSRDSKSASIAAEARKLADKHKMLRPRIFAQILEGATNVALKDTVETAVDGSSLYDSSTRFSVSGGNIETISSITNALLAYNAIWAFHTKFSQFLAPDGINPLLSPDEYSKLVIFVPPSKNQYWQEAAKQALRPQIVEAGVSTSVTGSGAAVDNLISKNEISVEIIPFVYLTDADDVYCFAANGKYKAIVEGTKQGLEEYEFGPHNSEEAAANAYETYQAFERFNMRAHFAQYTIKGNVA